MKRGYNVVSQSQSDRYVKRYKSNPKKVSLRKRIRASSMSGGTWTRNEVSPFSTYRVQRFQIAPRCITRLTTAFQGYLPVGAAATGYCIIYANQLFEPFFNATATVSTMLTGTDSSANTTQYNGYTVFNTQYGNYKIRKSCLRVRAVTGANGDTLNVWTYPYAQAAPVALQPPTIISHLGIPGLKKKIVSSGAGEELITNYVKISECLGLTNAEYEALPAIGFAGAPPASSAVNWAIQYSTIDGGVMVNQAYFFIEIDCEVEFSLPFPLIE